MINSPLKNFEYKPYSIANRYCIDTCAYKYGKKPYTGITLYDVNNPNKPLISSYMIK